MSEIIPGKKFDFGECILSEEDIISFAKAFDPLPFHTDKRLAGQTIFKGLIASGPHLFNHFYQREWLPRFGKTVICGLGVSNWKFIKPVYANRKIHCSLIILSLKPDDKIDGTAVSWLFEFFNEKKELVQVLQMDVMHHLNQPWRAVDNSQ